MTLVAQTIPPQPQLPGTGEVRPSQQSHDQSDRGRTGGERDDRDHHAGDDAQPRLVTIDSAGVPENQHDQQRQ
jgi:hypothetical protein